MSGRGDGTCAGRGRRAALMLIGEAFVMKLIS